MWYRNKACLSALLSSAIVLAMLAQLCLPVSKVFAAMDDAGQQRAAERMQALKVINGRPGGGDLALNETITRAETVTVLVRAFGQEETAKLLTNAASYRDIQGHWASGYVAMAKNIVAYNGEVLGFPDGSFNPDGNITTAEAFTFLMKFLGVKRDSSKSWPDDYIQGALNAGLITAEDQNFIQASKNSPATRGLVFYFADQAFGSYKLDSGKTVYTTYLDTQAPELTIESIPAITSEKEITINGTAVGATTVKIQDQNVSLDENKSFSYKILLNLGQNVINVVANDLAGNATTKTVTVAYTPIGALAKITATPNPTVPGTLVKLTAVDAFDNPIQSAAYTVDSTDATINQTTGEFVAQKNGNYTISATDGNVTVTTVIRIENAAPVTDTNSSGSRRNNNNVSPPTEVTTAPNAAVQSVAALTDMQVANGTMLNAVNLPAQVQITLSDNTKVNVPVTWDIGTPAYDGNAAGTYTFAGTLHLAGLQNVAATNLKAAITVVVATAPRTVQSVTALTDIEVEIEKALNLIGFPTEVQINLTDNTKVNVPVTWDGGTPAYNGNIAGTYTFIGALDLTGVPNLAATNLKASLNIVVEFAGGKGTALDPYIVKTPFQLSNLKHNLTAYYKLENDLDLNVAPYNQGEGWVPIGPKFLGSFDGNGHIIRNLFINRLTKSGGGLFAAVGEIGKIDNVKLENVSVSATKNAGGLAAAIYPGGMVTNSSVSGTVIGNSAAEGGQIGGLIGFNYRGTIMNSQASVTVNGFHRLGGLVGNNWGIIQNSHVTASTITGNTLVGGLTGLNYTDVSVANAVYAKIENSYADSVVKATYTYAGGLVGDNAGATLKNSFAVGRVTGNQYVGGLAGTSGDFTTWQGKIENCYAANDVTGVINVGGLVGAQIFPGQIVSSYYDSQTTHQSDTGKGTPKTTAEMQQVITFAGWNFTTTWKMQANQYPQWK